VVVAKVKLPVIIGIVPEPDHPVAPFVVLLIVTPLIFSVKLINVPPSGTLYEPPLPFHETLVDEHVPLVKLPKLMKYEDALARRGATPPNAKKATTKAAQMIKRFFM
jgi:hypothetical protein